MTYLTSEMSYEKKEDCFPIVDFFGKYLSRQFGFLMGQFEDDWFVEDVFEQNFDLSNM